MYGDRRPQFDPDQVLRNIRQGWSRFRDRMPRGGFALIVGGVFGFVFLIWMATGFYTVGPSEQAALRLFGEFRGTEGTGLHWYPPAPIGTRNVEAVQDIREMELGFRAGLQDVDVEALMITGDLNIVNVQMIVQYRISDLRQFLFEVDDPGEAARAIDVGRPEGRTLKDATEAALRQVVGQRSIDDPLRVAKEAVQEDTKALLQQILNSYEAGIEILSIQLQTVRPPDDVRDAFDDVNRARVDKERAINESLAYEQDQVPRARGAARTIIEAAEAFKTARIARARGEATEFDSVLVEYLNSKEVTRQRLYLEAMESILPGLTLFIVDQQGSSNLLPFLPLVPGVVPTQGGS